MYDCIRIIVIDNDFNRNLLKGNIGKLEIYNNGTIGLKYDKHMWSCGHCINETIKLLEKNNVKYLEINS